MRSWFILSSKQKVRSAGILRVNSVHSGSKSSATDELVKHEGNVLRRPSSASFALRISTRRLNSFQLCRFLCRPKTMLKIWCHRLFPLGWAAHAVCSHGFCRISNTWRSLECGHYLLAPSVGKREGRSDIIVPRPSPSLWIIGGWWCFLSGELRSTEVKWVVISQPTYHWRSDLQRLGLYIFPPFLDLDDKDEDEDEYSAFNAVDDTINSSNGGESPDLRKLQIVILGSEIMIQSKTAES